MNELPKWKKILQGAVYAIEDVITLLIAGGILIVGWLIDKTIFQNSALLWSSIIAILIVMAIGNLRDRLSRLKKIEDGVQETLEEIRSNKIFEIAGADQFFVKKSKIFQENLLTASKVDLLHITFSVPGEKLDIFRDLLKAHAEIRIIILDPSSQDALIQLVRRSWSKKASVEKYTAMLENTSDLLEEIGSDTGLSGSLKLGFLPFIPSYGISLLNSNQSYGTGFITIYAQLKKAKPSFLLEANNEPETFAFYKEQFELMWKECRVLKIV